MNEKKVKQPPPTITKNCQNLVGTQSKAVNSQNPLARGIFYPNHWVIDYKRLPHSSGWLYPHGLLSFSEFEKMALPGWFLSVASEVNTAIRSWQLLFGSNYSRSCSFHYLSKAAISEPAFTVYQVLTWLSFYRWHQYQVAYKSFPKPWLPY